MVALGDNSICEIVDIRLFHNTLVDVALELLVLLLLDDTSPLFRVRYASALLDVVIWVAI